MKKYFIELTDVVEYEVEARNQEEAINLALQWWDERMPYIKVSIIEENEDETD